MLRSPRVLHSVWRCTASELFVLFRALRSLPCAPPLPGCAVFVWAVPSSLWMPSFILISFQLGQSGAECRGDDDDPVRLDPRRVHAQALAGLRRQLPPLAQHPHAAAGPSSLSVCGLAYALSSPPFFPGVHRADRLAIWSSSVSAGQLWYPLAACSNTAVCLCTQCASK